MDSTWTWYDEMELQYVLDLHQRKAEANNYEDYIKDDWSTLEP